MGPFDSGGVSSMGPIWYLVSNLYVLGSRLGDHTGDHGTIGSTLKMRVTGISSRPWVFFMGSFEASFKEA